MKKILELIQGSAKTGTWLLIIIGFLGILLSVTSHMSVWETVKIINMPKKFNTGHITGLLIIGLIIVFVLFLLRSVYSILPVLLYFVYVLEKLFGTGIFRLIINSGTHKLRPGLYSTLPLSALCMLIGAIGIIIYRVNLAKN